MKTRIIINRHNVAKNKNEIAQGGDNDTCIPCISIQTYKETQYAKKIRLTGEWDLKQDFEKSPCSGATIWLEGDHRDVEVLA